MKEGNENMENLEEMFISARHAKVITNNHIREQEELYQKKAIDFLKVYNFNEVVAKACEKRQFSISPIPFKESALAYAVRDVLSTLGYTVKVDKFNNTYNLNISWMGL